MCVTLCGYLIVYLASLKYRKKLLIVSYLSEVCAGERECVELVDIGAAHEVLLRRTHGKVQYRLLLGTRRVSAVLILRYL